MDNRNGKIVFMPDIEYRAWCNKNAGLIDKIIQTGSISAGLLQNAQTKKFILRRLNELGYKVNL